MFRRNLLIGAAACAALACAGLTRADVLSAADVTVTPATRVVLLDDTTMPTTVPAAVPSTDATTAPTATAPAASGPPPLPLNAFLTDKIPHYGDLGISITGFVEGSYTFSDREPTNNILSDRSFDSRTESLQFDAIDLSIVRNVDYTKKVVDVGFTVEGMYGEDAAYIHSNGLALVSNLKQGNAAIPGAGGPATVHPRDQVDLVQANFTIMLPFLHGIGIEGGKFDTLVGYEVIDGPSNPFFSHSFIFDEEPFTHTGLLGIYNITDPNDATQSLTAIAGFSRGWDQATEDSNGSLDIMGQVKYQQFSAPGVVKNFVSLAFITGDETPSGNEATGGPQHDGWRTLFDLTGSYTLSDQWTIGGNAMYAWQAQDAVGTDNAGGITTGNPGTSQWYGVAGYAKWAINDYVALNFRAEWFDDQDGGAVTQLGAPSVNDTNHLQGSNQNISNQFYELTLGLTYKPLADDKYFNGLAIRPEVRWDYSNHRVFDPDSYNSVRASGHRDQMTFAVEAYFAF